MASIQEVKEGLSVCRDFARSASKRGNRIHKDTLDDNKQRMRALEGICGDCPNLRIEYRRRLYREVIMRCEARQSPIIIYKNTDLGQVPNCTSKPLN